MVIQNSYYFLYGRSEGVGYMTSFDQLEDTTSSVPETNNYTGIPYSSSLLQHVTEFLTVLNLAVYLQNRQQS